eukprot:Hpha_TRINITY_DN22898_c0_g1::TRINITY_DN22898_c0_g1_i1::g.84247::m.84247
MHVYTPQGVQWGVALSIWVPPWDTKAHMGNYEDTENKTRLTQIRKGNQVAQIKEGETYKNRVQNRQYDGGGSSPPSQMQDGIKGRRTALDSPFSTCPCYVIQKDSS